MDRRKFIKSAVPIAIGASLSNRLYGEPASLKTTDLIAKSTSDDVIKYRLSSIKINPKRWSELIELSKVWSEISYNHECATDFCENSEKYLEKKGVSLGSQSTLESELEALKVFVDRDIIETVSSGDLDDFFTVLSEKGVISDINNNSKLRQKLDEDFTRVFQVMKSSSSKYNTDPLYDLYSELGLLDENRDIRLVPGSQTVPVAAAAIVVLAVSVVAYATVAVTAGAGLLVAVAISVAAATAVTVGGNGGHGKKSDCTNSLLSEMKLAAQISDTLGNDKLTSSILEDIECAKQQIADNLDKVLDMAKKYKLIDYSEIDEAKVRSSLHSLASTQIINIT